MFQMDGLRLKGKVHNSIITACSLLDGCGSATEWCAASENCSTAQLCEVLYNENHSIKSAAYRSREGM